MNELCEGVSLLREINTFKKEERTKEVQTGQQLNIFPDNDKTSY